MKFKKGVLVIALFLLLITLIIKCIGGPTVNLLKINYSDGTTETVEIPNNIQPYLEAGCVHFGGGSWTRCGVRSFYIQYTNRKYLHN